MCELLKGTRDAVRRGFYIRPFARHEVRVSRLELPPLMWVFEWDMLAGWHSVLSIMYMASRNDIDSAIADGNEAANEVRRLRNEFQQAFIASGQPCAEKCTEALRSLEYQETLFDALAAWRQAFLSYYRWMDTGDRGSWTLWSEGRDGFDTAAAAHTLRFGKDLDFPAFDFRSASQFIVTAKLEPWTRATSGVFLVGAVALLTVGRISLTRTRGMGQSAAGWIEVLGRRAWTASLTPWRLPHDTADLRSSLPLAFFSLLIIGFLVESVSGFASQRLSVSALLIVVAAAVAVQTTARPAAREERDSLLLAGVVSLLPGLIVLLVIIGCYGALGFWSRFWISRSFRIMLLTVMLTQLLWSAFALLAARKSDRWSYRLGALLAAAGGGLLATVALLPGWLDVLRALNRPLNFAPATETMLIALRVYVGVNLDAGKAPWVIGSLLLVTGYFLARRRPPFNACVTAP